MPAERFYSTTDFYTDQFIELQEQEFHHLVHVMRMQMGEKVELVNGRGSMAQGVIEEISKKKSVIRILSVIHAEAVQEQIILVQAMPRLNRLEYILEKGTELGMTELWLFPGERSERKKIEAAQLARFETLTISALKQCGRLFLPKIALKPPLAQWSERMDNSFFGDLDPQAPWFLDKLRSGKKQTTLVFIGPEAGLSSAEEKKLRELGVEGVRLHLNILRVDTAALVSLALISSSQR